MSKGRPPIDKEMKAWRDRLAVIDAGLLACYETIDEGNKQKAVIKAKIAAREALLSRDLADDKGK